VGGGGFGIALARDCAEATTDIDTLFKSTGRMAETEGMQMAELLLDYRFEEGAVSNPDGSFSTTFTDVTTVAGPTSTPLGSLSKALDLGAAGRATVDLDGLVPDLARFCVRVVFKASSAVAGRQNLAESGLLPFSLFLDRGDRTGEFNLAGTVAPRAHGWRGPDTRFKRGLRPNRWYTVDLAYDADTAGLFVDGVCVGVYAFPEGAIDAGSDRSLFIGTWIDGARDHFDGALAALQWYAGIPAEIEALLNEQRERPEWFVTYKRESVRGRVDLGERTGKLELVPLADDSRLQRYERGAIMYQESVGVAFEMHGAIYDLYFSSRSLTPTLGYLVSDEVDTARREGRKSLFSRGGIYWSPRTGAVPVAGPIYLEYESLGEPEEIGLPVVPARNVSGGREQEFQRARMFAKTGSDGAFEVHGEILQRFLATGGLRTWGFPVSNELDVRREGRSIGRSGRFEFCTFYWSPDTGAHEVHGDIETKYEELGGPPGSLGFPTSDESDIPGVGGPARYNTFERGSVLWYGSAVDTVVAWPFRVFVGRIDSREDEGLFQGQNDIYCQVTVRDGVMTLYDQRHPASGYWDGQNVVEPAISVPSTIVPNDPGRVVTLIVDVWDYDDLGGGGSNRLGTWTKVLNIANGWGFRERSGVLDSGPFAKVNSITGAVQPDGDESAMTEAQKWWGMINAGTPSIAYSQYAAAFRDVDSEPEDWDVTDWLEKAFYELVVEGLAKDGNCVGMCVEAIHARRHSSMLGLPLDRFTRWEDVRKEFNIKHQHQVGAAAIWWFLSEVVTGGASDPVGVFTRTRQAFSSGNYPTLGLTQKWDFSGQPHTVLPVAWNDTVNPWEISVLDPNFTGSPRQLRVFPDENRFEYLGGDSYSGGRWTGGRLYFIPFPFLGERPRTPIWDAIMLILGGTVIILGADGQTERIAEPGGDDLDAFGTRAQRRLRAGQRIDEFFVGFKGSAADPRRRRPASVAGELLLRREPARGRRKGKQQADLSRAAGRTVGELTGDRRLRELSADLGNRRELKRALSGRTVRRVLADRRTAADLPKPVGRTLRELDGAGGSRNFVHTVTGRRRGTFQYVLKSGLSEVELRSSLRPGEQTEVRARDIGSNVSEIRLSPERGKLFRIELRNKLGVRGDRISIVLDRVPVSGGGELGLSAKPGLGGIELVGQVADRDILVTIDGLVEGRAFSPRFTVPTGGGISLDLGPVVTGDGLSVASIDRLFGPAINGRLIEG